MSEERRRFIRVRSRLIAFLKFPETGKVRRALTLDVSAGGARLVTEEVLAAGTPLEIELKLPDREAPIRCTAEVVRSVPMPGEGGAARNPTAETAIRFTQIDPRDHAELTFYAKLNPPPA
ncbi:MAG: PilZ domain-containing protein [Candidatus Omnitrophica bacterium]|nr:PilZ domain-containing protein [Candidatus Omnitrophota bacterium]